MQSRPTSTSSTSVPTATNTTITTNNNSNSSTSGGINKRMRVSKEGNIDLSEPNTSVNRAAKSMKLIQDILADVTLPSPTPHPSSSHYTTAAQTSKSTTTATADVLTTSRDRVDSREKGENREEDRGESRGESNPLRRSSSRSVLPGKKPGSSSESASINQHPLYEPSSRSTSHLVDNNSNDGIRVRSASAVRTSTPTRPSTTKSPSATVTTTKPSTATTTARRPTSTIRSGSRSGTKSSTPTTTTGSKNPGISVYLTSDVYTGESKIPVTSLENLVKGMRIVLTSEGSTSKSQSSDGHSVYDSEVYTITGTTTSTTATTSSKSNKGNNINNSINIVTITPVLLHDYTISTIIKAFPNTKIGLEYMYKHINIQYIHTILYIDIIEKVIDSGEARKKGRLIDDVYNTRPITYTEGFIDLVNSGYKYTGDLSHVYINEKQCEMYSICDTNNTTNSTNNNSNSSNNSSSAVNVTSWAPTALDFMLLYISFTTPYTTPADSTTTAPTAIPTHLTNEVVKEVEVGIPTSEFIYHITHHSDGDSSMGTTTPSLPLFSPATLASYHSFFTHLNTTYAGHSSGVGDKVGYKWTNLLHSIIGTSDVITWFHYHQFLLGFLGTSTSTSPLTSSEYNILSDIPTYIVHSCHGDNSIILWLYRLYNMIDTDNDEYISYTQLIYILTQVDGIFDRYDVLNPILNEVCTYCMYILYTVYILCILRSYMYTTPYILLSLYYVCVVGIYCIYFV